VAGAVSEKEADEMFKLAARLRTDVAAWIRDESSRTTGFLQRRDFGPRAKPLLNQRKL